MHALVVGGTGMLREVSLHLAQTADTVSVVARRPEVLPAFPHIRPSPLDYRDDEALAGALRQAVTEAGPITMAVCWIHNMAPGALATVVGGRGGARPHLACGRQDRRQVGEIKPTGCILRRQAGRLVVGTCCPMEGVNTGSQPTSATRRARGDAVASGGDERRADQAPERGQRPALAPPADEVQAERPTAKDQEPLRIDSGWSASSSSRYGCWGSSPAAGRLRWRTGFGARADAREDGVRGVQPDGALRAGLFAAKWGLCGTRNESGVSV